LIQIYYNLAQWSKNKSFIGKNEFSKNEEQSYKHSAVIAYIGNFCYQYRKNLLIIKLRSANTSHRSRILQFLNIGIE